MLWVRKENSITRHTEKYSILDSDFSTDDSKKGSRVKVSYIYISTVKNKLIIFRKEEEKKNLNLILATNIYLVANIPTVIF